MPNKLWKDMGFRIDKTSSLTDITAYINQQDLSSTIKTIEDTALSDTIVQKVPGLASGQMSVNGFWNTTTEAIFGPCIDGTAVTKTAEFKSYTGRYYNGEVIPSSIKVSGKEQDMQLFSATLDWAGAINRTSVALP